VLSLLTFTVGSRSPWVLLLLLDMLIAPARV
jgi:hypothetical protein